MMLGSRSTKDTHIARLVMCDYDCLNVNDARRVSGMEHRLLRHSEESGVGNALLVQ